MKAHTVTLASILAISSFSARALAEKPQTPARAGNDKSSAFTISSACSAISASTCSSVSAVTGSKIESESPTPTPKHVGQDDWSHVSF